LIFESENQLNIQNYLSIPFCDFHLIARSQKRPHHYQFNCTTKILVPGIEECEDYWHLNRQKLVLTKKQASKN